MSHDPVMFLKYFLSGPVTSYLSLCAWHYRFFIPKGSPAL